MINIIIQLIFLLLIIYFLIYIVWLYIIAKQKHRDEWVKLYWFFGDKFGTFGLSVPRAIIRPFLWLNIKNKIGITIAGVRLFIINEMNELLIGIVEKTRQQNGLKYDIGVGGAIANNDTIEKTLIDETYQEIGIELKKYRNNIKYLKTMLPIKDHNFIIYNYMLKLKKETKFVSVDGTYIDFEWRTIDEILKMDNKIVRNDPQNYIENNKNDILYYSR